MKSLEIHEIDKSIQESLIEMLLFLERQQSIEKENSTESFVSLPCELENSLKIQAESYLQNGELEKAKSLYELLALHGGSPIFLVRLGAVYMKLFLFEKALKFFSLAQILLPDNPYTYFFAAYCYYALQEKEQCLLCLEHALVNAQRSHSSLLLFQKIQEFKRLLN